MNPRSLLIVATIGLLTALTASGDQPKLAILQFEVTVDNQPQPAVARQLTDRLGRRLIQLNRVELVDDIDVAQEMQRLEQELKTGDAEKVAPKLGKSLGADQILIPRVLVFGKRITMTAKLVDAGKSRTVNVYEAEKTGESDAIFDLLDEVVKQMKADPLLGIGGDAAALTPPAVEGLLTRAETAIQFNRANDALTAVEEARKAAPENPAVLTRCMALYITLGKPELALEAIRAWQKRVGAGHPDYRAMVTREFELERELAELKRIAEKAAGLLTQLEAAFAKKDASLAWSIYEELQSTKPDHPGIAAWRERMATLESPAQREQRLAREKRAAEIRTVTQRFDAAVEAKNATDADRAFEELRAMDGGHAALAEWTRKLEQLRPPWEAFFPMTADQARNVQQAAAQKFNLPVAKSLTVGSTAIELVLIPPGEFVREGQRVRISRPFYLGKYEVTQRQWRAVMGDDPSGLKGDNRPVERVSWEDAHRFTARATSQSGATIRLPSEAEWEFACRAGMATEYSFGDEEAMLPQHAWFDANVDETQPVGRLKPNHYGLFDMHGNVWEWCQDWSGDDPRGSVTDPTGPGSGSARVLRGGSWVNYPGSCRSAIRNWSAPGVRLGYIGFRVVSGTP